MNHKDELKRGRANKLDYADDQLETKCIAENIQLLLQNCGTLNQGVILYWHVVHL